MCQCQSEALKRFDNSATAHMQRLALLPSIETNTIHPPAVVSTLKDSLCLFGRIVLPVQGRFPERRPGNVGAKIQWAIASEMETSFGALI